MHPILQSIYGSNCDIVSQNSITDGYKNSTYKVTCSEYETPLFVKIEKPFAIPRTQVYQVKKEVAGIVLCGNAGLPIPKIIKSDADGQAFGSPWIVADFINAQLIHEFQLSDENKKALGKEYEIMYAKISGITNEFFGDAFSGGFIGQHESWNSAITKITQLIYEDCVAVDVFGKKAEVVGFAIKKALSKIKSNHRSVFFHCDLFSANIMGVEKGNAVHISHIIDFGMSLFASECYSQYLTWKYTDFAVTPLDVCQKYGVAAEELEAYDIIRMEAVLLANIFKLNEADALTAQFIQKCEEYVFSK